MEPYREDSGEKGERRFENQQKKQEQKSKEEMPANRTRKKKT